MSRRKLCVQLLTVWFIPAPAAFQARIAELLIGIPQARAYFDNILIASRTIDEHRANVRAVLQRLDKVNLKLNLKRYCLMKIQVISFLSRSVKKNFLYL